MRKTLLAFSMLATLLFSADLRAQQKTIVETAIAAGNFNTLVTAVKAAGLVETLTAKRISLCHRHGIHRFQ